MVSNCAILTSIYGHFLFVLNLQPVWKKNKNQHCGRPECMFECECGPKTRAMVLKKSPASLLTTNNIIKVIFWYSVNIEPNKNCSLHSVKHSFIFCKSQFS